MKELKIFAKHGTKEKVLAAVSPRDTGETMIILSEKYGGDWLFVETLGFDEMLMFTDDLEYHGFSPKIARYSSAIIPYIGFKEKQNLLEQFENKNLEL